MASFVSWRVVQIQVGKWLARPYQTVHCLVYPARRLDLHQTGDTSAVWEACA